MPAYSFPPLLTWCPVLLLSNCNTQFFTWLPLRARKTAMHVAGSFVRLPISHMQAHKTLSMLISRVQAHKAPSNLISRMQAHKTPSILISRMHAHKVPSMHISRMHAHTVSSMHRSSCDDIHGPCVCVLTIWMQLSTHINLAHTPIHPHFPTHTHMPTHPHLHPHTFLHT